MNTSVQNWGRFLVDAVRSYAEQNTIKFELFSGDWIIRLQKGDVVKYLFGNDFGVNNTSALALCNDKSATYQVLTREGVPALEHRILLRPNSLGASESGTLALVQQAMLDFGGKVICKPNTGGGGSDIFLAESNAQLEAIVLELFSRYRTITISPFVHISAEYRICILNGVVELIYEKVRSSDELQHNLSHGALAREVTDTQLWDTLESMAQRAAYALNGTFVHVDIINVNGVFSVLEVNGGIIFEHYSAQSEENKARATEIYYKALDLLFL